MKETKISTIGGLVAIFVVLLLLLPSVGEAQDVTLTPEGKVPGKPFDDLQGQINVLETKVAALEASGGGGAERVVISGSVDLDSTGDEIREIVDSSGRRRVAHFKVFSILGLATDDPPAVTLYRRRRTENVNAPIDPSEFVIYNDVSNQSDDDNTLLIFDNGRILLRFRRERFDADGNLLDVRYGLDGPGGTGEFRLVLIR